MPTQITHINSSGMCLDMNFRTNIQSTCVRKIKLHALNVLTTLCGAIHMKGGGFGVRTSIIIKGRKKPSRSQWTS